MTLFWILAALMMLLSLAFIVIPLSRSPRADQASEVSASIAIHRERMKELKAAHARGQISSEQLTEAQDEIARLVLADAAPGIVAADSIEREAGADRAAVLGAAAVIPALAVILYFWLGDVGALNESEPSKPASPALSARAPGSTAEHGVSEMVARLETRLRSAPDDVPGWVLLGRSYGYLKQYDKAVAALSKANDLEPGNAGTMVDLAELLMVANGHRIDARAQSLLDKVLALEPEHPKAKFLLGLKKGGEAHVAEGPGRPGATPPARQSGGKLLVSVRVSDDLTGRLPPDATVFVYARPAQGPRMPLAIVRRPASELPMQVELSDAQAMSPEHRLSQHARITVGARVSASGSAMPRPGDLEGSREVSDWRGTAAAGSAIRVEIDHAVR